jgi:cobalt/nickel transport protein
MKSRRAASVLLVVGLVAAASGGWLWLLRSRAAVQEWPGVDETVIGHFAEAAGRPEPAFALDWVRGDLLLFAFLCAGLLAGGLIGFFARAIFVEPREHKRGGDAE